MIKVATERPASFDPVVEVAGTFVEVGDQILLMHRHPDKPYGETWGIPAGKIEKGETPYHAALRELEEETGIKATALRSLGPLYVSITYDFIFHIFAVRLDQKPRVLHETDAHQDWEWITPQDALSYPLIIGGRETFLYYIEQQKY